MSYSLATMPHHCPQCSLETEYKKPFCERCCFDLKHGSLKRKNRNVCIYCSNKDLTLEHLFPDWISKIYPNRYTNSPHFLARPKDSSTPYTENDFKVYPHKGDPYQKGVYNVCQNCNNGWMSLLQIEAKPLVISLANGDWKKISKKNCFTLARWAAMLSLNFQCHARQLITPERQRKTLKNGKIPSGWRVYIGRMCNASCAGLSFNRSIMAKNVLENGILLPLSATYFCIEKAFFCVVSTLDDKYFPSFAYNSATPGGGIGLGSDARLPMRAIWPENKDSLESILTSNSNMDGLDIIRIEGMLGGVSEMGLATIENPWGFNPYTRIGFKR